jgi:hypothetical protein
MALSAVARSTNWTAKILHALPHRPSLVLLNVEGTLTSRVRGPRGSIQVRPGVEQLLGQLMMLDHKPILWSESQSVVTSISPFSALGLACYPKQEAIAVGGFMTLESVTQLLGMTPDVMVDDNPNIAVPGIKLIIVPPYE